MKLVEKAKELFKDIRESARAAVEDFLDRIEDNERKQTERILQMLLNEPKNARKNFEVNLKATFTKTAWKVKQTFRTWRTEFTNRWRYEGGELLKKAGKTVTWVWICVFRNSRESHMDMHEQEREQGVPFISGAGNELRYPADHSAPIEEWINCQCYIVKKR